MDELVYYHDLNKEPYTTNEIISEYSGVKLRSINDLTREHRSELEKFGRLEFSDLKSLNPNGGRARKEWHYNQEQATLLITFMKNTPKVVEFKTALVKSFYSATHELQQRQLMLERNKQTNKDLGEVIKEHYPDKPFMYSTFHNLAYKLAVGIHPKQIKAEYSVTNAPDALSADQLEKIESYRTIMANMLSIGMDYKAIKQALTQEN